MSRRGTTPSSVPRDRAPAGGRRLPNRRARAHVTIPPVVQATSLSRAAPGGHRDAVLPLTASLVGVAVAALALSADLSHPAGESRAAISLHVAGGLTYVLVGGAAWWHRPHNRTGQLMVAVGIAWFVQDLTHVRSPLVYALGDFFYVGYFGILGQLVLTFPSGRLESMADRVVVTAGYVWALGGNVFTQVLLAPAGSADIFAIHRDATQNLIADGIQQGLDATLCVTLVLLVVLHYVRGTPPARRALAPAIWASGPMLLAAILLSLPGLIGSAPGLESAVPVFTPIALASLPVAFVFGLLRSRLAVASAGHLVVELGASPPPERIRDALAETLHDPSLALAYQLPGRDGWVDAAGRPLSLPDRRSGRAYTILERGGEAVAALIHDRSLENDPSLVAVVAGAAALAIENERLQADVRAKLTEVMESRARLVTVADHERRRLERDLHDGAQQRLVALALTLSRAGERLDERPEETRELLLDGERQLGKALEELRRLAAGIRPAILSDAGLGAALESLAENAAVPVTLRTDVDRRLPDQVESAAYFAVCEALTNAAKHAEATQVTVTARLEDERLLVEISDDGAGGAEFGGGSGLNGLVDRITALDGHLTLDSPVGGGTRLEVDLPCA
jgi:signal transduction histidine kinase